MVEVCSERKGRDRKQLHKKASPQIHNTIMTMPRKQLCNDTVSLLRYVFCQPGGIQGEVLQKI